MAYGITVFNLPTHIKNCQSLEQCKKSEFIGLHFGLVNIAKKAHKSHWMTHETLPHGVVSQELFIFMKSVE